MVIMSPQKLMAVRDPQGIRPLAMGKLGDQIVFASESVAFDSIGAEFVRDIRPGEIVVVDKNRHALDGKPLRTEERPVRIRVRSTPLVLTRSSRARACTWQENAPARSWQKSIRLRQISSSALRIPVWTLLWAMRRNPASHTASVSSKTAMSAVPSSCQLRRREKEQFTSSSTCSKLL